jgi:hypothetical protein
MSKGTTPEGIVLAWCMKYLRIHNIYAWRNNTGAVQIRPGQFMSFGKVGSSDILGILPGGRILCVECKAPGGRLSPEQKQFLEDVKALGGLCLVVKNWRELDTALRTEGYVDDGPLFEGGTDVTDPAVSTGPTVLQRDNRHGSIYEK